MIEMNEAEGLSQAMATAQIARIARRSTRILKIAAGVIAIGAVVNGWISATFDQNEMYGNPPMDFPFQYELNQFLYATVPNLGWAALILAAAFAIEIVGLRAARTPQAPAELPGSNPSSSSPTAAPTNFAARPTPAPTPPPMKIASDEDIWRR